MASSSSPFNSPITLMGRNGNIAKLQNMLFEKLFAEEFDDACDLLQYLKSPECKQEIKDLGQTWLVNYLLQCAVKGMVEQIIPLLRLDPQLWLIQGSVVDHTGHEIFSSGFGIALRAGDTYLLQQTQEFIDSLPVVGVVPTGPMQVLAQINQYFAHAKEDKEEKKNSYDFNRLFETILNDESLTINRDVLVESKRPIEERLSDYRSLLNPETVAALAQFKKFFSIENKTLIPGSHLNSRPLIEALRVNAQRTERSAIRTRTQNFMLWQEVIGHLYFFQPECYYYISEYGFDRRSKPISPKHLTGRWPFSVGHNSVNAADQQALAALQPLNAAHHRYVQELQSNYQERSCDASVS